MKVPTIAEFQRWRDAPADRKDRIAREKYSIGQRSWSPVYTGTTFRKCRRRMVSSLAIAPKKIAEMAEWLRALVRASRSLLEATSIRLSSGNGRV
jgi:hypothetical protein